MVMAWNPRTQVMQPIPLLRFTSVQAAPTLTAGANNGASPPTPTLTTGSNDYIGILAFGSGTGPAAGNQVVVTFSSPFPTGTNYAVFLYSSQQLTPALNLYVPTSLQTIAAFTIASVNAPAASQSVGTYGVFYVVMPLA